MEYSPFDRLWIASNGEETVWTVLWLVLAAMTVTLMLLMYTRWGRSRALEKCALLSLLAHALLAGVCTSVQLADGVGETPSEGSSDYAHVVVEFSQEPASNTSESQPWEEFAAAPAEIEQSSLDRASAGDSQEPARQTADVDDPAYNSNLEAPFIPRPNDDVAAADVPTPSFARSAAAEMDAASRVAQAVDAPSIDPAQAEMRREVADDTTVARNADHVAAPSAIDPIAGNPIRHAPTNLPSADSFDMPNLPRQAAGGGTDNTGVASRGSSIEPLTAPGGISPRVGGIGTGRAGLAGGDPRSAAEVPDIYRGRSAPNRGQIAARGGGSAKTEAAVDGALAWLAANQSADGRWDVAKLEGGLEPRTAGHDRQGAGIGADTGITGLALLAFLGRGHTHLEGDYRDTVRRGLEFLLNAQNRRGSVEGEARLFAKMYCHGMGALALSEAYAMTNDARLANAVRDAVAFTSAAQHTATGGWRYLPAQAGDNSPGSLGDMSQHGWQVMILKSAQLAGIRPDDVVLAKAAKFVTATASGKHGGLSSYRPKERVTSTMTAEALVCRWFLDMSRGEALDHEAGDQLLKELPSADAPNFYYWYYGTLAMHEIKGEHWRKWNEAMQRVLLSSQRRDGAADGSWDPDSIWGGYGGRTYSTALGALSLEVYYRYLPLYKPVETAGRDAAEVRRQ
jgi:hypothetical protein